MPHSVDRMLVFRLGETGFLLALDRLVEIREQIAELFDDSYADAAQGIVGAFAFRQTQIPVIDPSVRLAVSSGSCLADKQALVLKGSEGNWALLVDSVEEIISAEKLNPCEIPPLLKPAVAPYYTRLGLLSGEPMVYFEADRFYGAGVPG